MNRAKQWARTYWPYVLLAAAVMLPLWAPGYILTLDAVFVPHIAAPTALTSDYLWQWLLHVLNSIVPSQIVEKCIFCAVLVLAGVGMHWLLLFVQQSLRRDKTLRWAWATYAGGLLYAANPFVYDRFMAGQYGVLLGYALLPFFVRLLLEFCAQLERRQALRVALLATVVCILSLPTIGELALAGFCIVAAAAWQQRSRPTVLRAYAKGIALLLGTFLLLSSYWLVPFVLGKGVTAAAVQQFTSAHTASFATAGHNAAERFVAGMRLQGFWMEPRQLFRLPQDVLPGWGTVRLLVWGLVAVGAVVYWRHSRRLAASFGALGLVGLLLAAGLFAGVLTHIGYREPQKFVGLTALTFSLFVAAAAARIAGWGSRRSEVSATSVATALFVALFLFTPTMYWGFAGQLRTSEYPPGWVSADHFLRTQPGNFQSLFLPWHEYMSYGFSGRIMANPAPRYFSRPVIASNNPEIGQVTPSPQAIATKLGVLLRSQDPPHNLGAQLAVYNVRYILLAKEYDYRSYQTLLHDPAHFHRVLATPSIDVYENELWEGKQ